VDQKILVYLGYLANLVLLANLDYQTHQLHLEDHQNLDTLVVLGNPEDQQILDHLEVLEVLAYLDFPANLDYLGILANLDYLGILANLDYLDYLDLL
jgi:hypothetical protein